MREFTELLAAANNELWAMRQQSLRPMLLAASNQDQAARPSKLPKIIGRVAIVPITGMIVQRGSIWDELMGATSTMRFEAAFSRAYNEPQVGGIVIDVDSPGGTTYGVQLAAERVFSTRGMGKPVVAVANSMACSAAYWIASAAEHLVAVPGAAHLGNIGVYRMHEDVSEMLAQKGVKVTIISKPEYKTEGNPYEPMSKEAMEYQQSQVDHSYEVFNAAVAKHRGVTPAVARESFGKGRDMHAEAAKECGLIDRIASMETVLGELLRGAKAEGVSAESHAIEERIQAAWNSGQVEELCFTPQYTGETAKLRKKLLEQRMAW